MEEVLGNATKVDGNPPNGVPGQLPAEKEQPLGKRLHGNKNISIGKKSLVGEKVTIKTRNNGAMTWTVITSHDPPNVIQEKEQNNMGLRALKLETLREVRFCAHFFDAALQRLEKEGGEDKCRSCHFKS
jgi:hypothetical protein